LLLLESALCGIYPCTKIDFARNPCKTAKIKIDLVIVECPSECANSAISVLYQNTLEYLTWLEYTGIPQKNE